ncbi:hypothetical protein NYO99_04710 [Pelomonas sp. UHG3]|uniref:Uncharacterized protein n=1 Tax=Roseateles hydrophilus TaxID=2975054 RepID=A0ACC6C790_9BURK|nr:hypothetical protein [Pelomonas sp. UHG3]MCY4744265.1 hypothetical protein [Pelomonas sp. UHG3]
MSAAAVHPRRPPDPRLVQRCLLLAALLHVWLVLMFGTAPSNTAPGQSGWGSLTVKLRGLSGAQSDAPPAAQPGGSTAPEAATAPAAARTAAVSEHTDAPADAATSTATLVLPDGFRPVERQDLGPPPAATAPALPAADLPAGRLARLEARPDASVAPLTPAARLAPTPLPAARADLPTLDATLPTTVNRLDASSAAAALTPALPRPADLRATTPPTPALPAAAELPNAVARLEAPQVPATTGALPRAADLRAAPPGASPMPPPAVLPAPVQRLEAATPEGGTVTPLSRASALRPAPTSASTTALPGAQDLPAPVRRLESESAAAVAPLQPTAAPRAPMATPAPEGLGDLAGSLPGQVSPPAGLAQGDPAARIQAPARAAGVAPGPDAGTRVGPEAAPPPQAAASAPRAPLNLSLPRGDMTARRGSSGVIALIPPPPERKSKLEQSVEDAANKDCRKAYSGAGLLAVVPLAIDAARGKGCKW